jgi:carbon monoxide dehydrogenase subunit G
MRSQRSRDLAAPLDDVWRLVSDPYAMPRWWPRTQRVEGVRGDGFTTLLGAERSGRTVRADWRLESSRKPVRRFTQELEGSPFERLFVRHAVEIALAPADAPNSTRATLAIEQQVRGWARLAPFMIKRAMRRQIAEALDGLERAFG